MPYEFADQPASRHVPQSDGTISTGRREDLAISKRELAQVRAVNPATLSSSGKLNREVVNIEGGSLTLLTSTDAKVIEKLHAMSDDKVAVRVKS